MRYFAGAEIRSRALPHPGGNRDMIRAAVGFSRDPSSTRAAVDAAAQAVLSLEGPRPDWAIGFVSPEHGPHLDALLEALSSKLETPYVAGCSASGLIAPGEEFEEGPFVGVLAAASDQLRATPFLFHDEGDQGLTAGLRLGQRFAASRESDDLLVVCPDPFHVRPDRLLQSLAATLGGVPVVGGAASGNGAKASTFQFCGTEAGRSAVAGFRLGGSFRHVIGVTHGCKPLGGPLRVTRSHENLILELEGRPAGNLLRELAPAKLLADTALVLRYLAVGMLPDGDPHPIESGHFVVRNIVAYDPDTGVVAISDRVEEGQHLFFVARESGAARADLARMLRELSPERTGLRYRFGIYFNCLARGRTLYGDDGIDSATLAEALPGIPILGFFGNAEIGPLDGVNQLFTYTGLLLLVAE